MTANHNFLSGFQKIGRNLLYMKIIREQKGQDAFHEFGSLFCYAILNYDACVLHGVVMEYNGMEFW